MTKREWLDLEAKRKALVELYAKEGVTEDILFGKLKPETDEAPRRPPPTPMPSGGERMLR